jgi:hypothetical protein
MALKYFDGFDYLNSANGAVLTSLGYYGNPSISVGNGRFGGNALSIGYSGYVAKTLGVNITTGFVGFALNLAYGGLATFGIGDVTNGTAPQFTVQFNTYGVIGIYDSNGILRGSSSINAWLLNTWAYIEVGFTIAGGTAGSVTVRVNGAVVVTVPGLLTQASSNGWGNTLLWTNPARSNYYVDDLYVNDNSGAAPYNSFLGNVRVQAVLPAAAGSLTQFLKSSTSLSNWQCAINQNCDDTLYVYSATVGNEDLYIVSASIGAVTIYGVQVRGCYRQDDATQRSAQTLLKSGSTFATTAVVPCNQTYAFQTDGPWIVDPNTGASWLPSAVNALQIGPKVAA